MPLQLAAGCGEDIDLAPLGRDIHRHARASAHHCRGQGSADVCFVLWQQRCACFCEVWFVRSLMCLPCVPGNFLSIPRVGVQLADWEKSPWGVGFRGGGVLPAVWLGPAGTPKKAKVS